MMSTGIDWNGNGKYDPTDAGIDMAQQGAETEEREKKCGCLASMVLFLPVFPILLLRLFRRK